VLRWHRELVRRKWSYPRHNQGGRPAIDKELENLIVRLAKENPRWGYGKIQGELIKLKFAVSQSTVRNVFNRYHILPAPVRNGSIGWRQLMQHYKAQMLACVFFTVETIRLQTIYVFFFIEIGTRRVHLAGLTPHPSSLWVTQQARRLIWELDDSEVVFRFLIRDNDTKFMPTFDTVFETEGIQVIPTPFQAPNANAHAERWVRTVREECLDHILVLNEKHLKRVLDEFVADYYNVVRPPSRNWATIPHLQPTASAYWRSPMSQAAWGDHQ
jgi:putative transposase